jgi:hypothetical protein
VTAYDRQAWETLMAHNGGDFAKVLGTLGITLAWRGTRRQTAEVVIAGVVVRKLGTVSDLFMWAGGVRDAVIATGAAKRAADILRGTP